MAERFRIAPKTVRDGIAEARGRREERERENLPAGPTLTRRERQEITKAYGNPNSKIGGRPEVQEWLSRLRKVGALDPATAEGDSAECTSAGEDIKRQSIPPDWNGWGQVVKDDESGKARIVIPRRRKILTP